jgi:hypothetical protein
LRINQKANPRVGFFYLKGVANGLPTSTKYVANNLVVTVPVLVAACATPSATEKASPAL